MHTCVGCTLHSSCQVLKQSLTRVPPVFTHCLPGPREGDRAGIVKMKIYTSLLNAKNPSQDTFIFNSSFPESHIWSVLFRPDVNCDKFIRTPLTRLVLQILKGCRDLVFPGYSSIRGSKRGEILIIFDLPSPGAKQIHLCLVEMEDSAGMDQTERGVILLQRRSCSLDS